MMSPLWKLLLKSLSLAEQFTTWCIPRGLCALTHYFQRNPDSAEFRDGWDTPFLVRLHLRIAQVPSGINLGLENLTILGSPTRPHAMLRVIMCYFPPISSQQRTSSESVSTISGVQYR